MQPKRSARQKKKVSVKDVSKSVSWIWYLVGVLVIIAAVYFIFNGMTGKVVSSLNYDDVCSASWNGSTFGGFADLRGFVASVKRYNNNSVLKNNSFVCFAGNFYYCGEGNETFAPRTTNGKIIGNWICNMSNANWVASTSSISSIVEKNGRCTLRTSADIAWTANGNIARDLNDPLVLAKGGKFLCYNNYYYECGWVGKDYSVAFEAQNKTFVGDYVCDLTSKKWVLAKDNEMSGVPNLGVSSCIDSNWGDGYNRYAFTNSTNIYRYGSLLSKVGDAEDSSFTPGSILCSDSSFYSCGDWAFSNKGIYNNDPSFNRSEFAQAISNQSFVGGWKCNIDQRKWVYEGSTVAIDLAPKEAYFNDAAPFQIKGSPEAKYTINWTYVFSDSYSEVVSQSGTVPASFSRFFNNSGMSSNASNRTLLSVNYTVYDDRGSSVRGNLLIKYRCTSECTLIGSKNCTGDIQYHACGNFDSDACFEWSTAVSTCSSGVCNSTFKECVSPTATKTCIGNMFCALRNINNANVINRSDLNCGVDRYKCYECNDSRGYSVNSTLDGCTKDGCPNSNTCETSAGNGICSIDPIIGDGIVVKNESKECCSVDSVCYVCATGYHPFNGTCVSNNCTGIQPTGFNFTQGANTSLTGNNTWNYNATLRGATALTCQWGCDVGFRIDLANNNSCVAGDPTCSEVSGVCLSSLGNATTIAFGNCTSGGTCSKCNIEYGFNGTACVKSYCESGKIWNGFECTIDTIDGVCASGCKYNGNCIGNSLRIDVSAKRYYCPLSGSAFVEAKSNGVACSSNFECQKNLCGKGGKCTDIVSELQSNVNFIGGAVCKLRELFNIEILKDCLTRHQVSL